MTAPEVLEDGAVDYAALAKIGYEASCNKKWEWASRGCQIGWTDAVKAIVSALRQAARQSRGGEA